MLVLVLQRFESRLCFA